MHKNDRVIIISGVGVTILAIVLAFIMGSFEVATSAPPPAVPSEPNIVAAAPQTQAGSSDANTEQVIQVPLQNPVNVTVTLTWTDEPDGTGCPPPAARWVNQPDNFGLSIEGPGAANVSASQEPIPNTHGQPGVVTLTVTVNYGDKEWTKATGNWNITVVCGTCGMEAKKRPAVFGYTDPGNDWEITIEYSGYETGEGGN